MPPRNLAVVTFATLAFVLSQANLAWMLGPLDPSLFSLQLAFTPHEFWNVVERWGPDGVGRYRAHFVYDFVHPFIYGALGYVWVRNTTLFAGISQHAALFWTWALPVAGLCDLLENAIHLHLLNLEPGDGGALVAVSGTASSIKWSLALLFTLVLLLRTVQSSWHRRRSARQA